MSSVIALCCAVVCMVGGWFWRKKLGKTAPQEAKPLKKYRMGKRFSLILMVAGVYLFLVQAVRLIFGVPEKEPFSVEISAERVDVFGVSLSTTILLSWCAMAVLILLALVLRFTVLRNLQQVPKGAQNVLEICVETIEKYTHSKAGDFGEGLCAYLFTVAAFLVACSMLELFGFRAPTADITLTFALSLVSFVLINYYGIRKKGVGGRVKSLASPTPMVFPMRVVSDLAIPVSMACRLFGNMLGGMIVMDLIYSSMGGAAIGIPSVVGLYFNVFHPLIQTFIFITLTLTFIRESTE